MKKSKKPLGRRRKNWLGFIITIAFLIGVSLFLLSRLDNVFMPMALDIAQKKIISDISTAIDKSYSSIIEEQHIEAADLFISEANENSGKITSMYVDTILVNEICNKLAVRVSTEMNSLSKQSIPVPVGSLSGYQIFSGVGPSYNIRIQPVGDALVDPRSERETVGINQVNILVWLDVKCEARIVVPFQKGREITVSRSLPLINTYFSQEVPNTYWNGRSAVISPNTGE